ncbi:MAG TPA: carboxypeptidase-like regulatory domain-containing protein, partial [Bryobacteraceae bacterium]|nr:carboxypeptidase-like regulatory domain-containing protein [Bryobacteraceae bacterium]
MRRLVTLAFLCALTLRAQTPAVSGRVLDANGGEPLANVSIQIGDLRTVSDDAGRFHIDTLPPGDYTLRASTVNYHVVTQQFQLTAGEPKNFEIVLSPDNLARTDTVNVTAGPF